MDGQLCKEMGRRMVQQSLIIDHGWPLVQRNGMGWFKVGATRWDGQPVQQCCNNGWCNEMDRQVDIQRNGTDVATMAGATRRIDS